MRAMIPQFPNYSYDQKEKKVYRNNFGSPKESFKVGDRHVLKRKGVSYYYSDSEIIAMIRKRAEND